MSESEFSSAILKRREEARWRAYLDRHDIEQGRLPFDAYRPADGDLHVRVKQAAALDIKDCKYSRNQIADGLSRLTGKPVTVAQIDAAVAETHSHRIPAEWLPAWSRVTGSTRILEMLAAEIGMWLSDATDHDLADLARAELQQQNAARRAATLRRLLTDKL